MQKITFKVCIVRNDDAEERFVCVVLFSDGRQAVFSARERATVNMMIDKIEAAVREENRINGF